MESNNDQVAFVEQDDEANLAAAEEAFYWGTIHDFVQLMRIYGRDAVLTDFRLVAEELNEKKSDLILPT